MIDQDKNIFPYRTKIEFSIVKESRMIKELFGPCGERWNYTSTHWCFQNESDLTWFLLKVRNN